MTPMIRCLHCELRQYAPVTHATRAECVRCGRPLALERADLIAPAIAAGRLVRRRARRVGGERA
jgi:uncharacterized paraquat-inducible protein A